MVDLVAQWLNREAQVVEVFMTVRVQIQSWSLCFFFFAHLFVITFHNSLFFFLYIGFSDHLLSFLPHFLTFIVVSILKTFYFQISVSISESVIFVTNISVIGILENFHIGAPLVCS